MSTIDSSLSLGRMQAEAAATDRSLAKTTDPDRAEIKKIADDFESLFLNLVLKSMRNTVQKSGFLDGGNAEDIYRSMLDDEYSKMMATQRHTGIANQIEQFILKSQGLEAADQTGKAATTGGGPEPAAAAANTLIPQAANAAKSGHLAYKDAALQNPVKGATMESRATALLKAL